MSEADREIQERVRRFVDEELIPLEVETELSGGRLSDDVREKHHHMAIELGLWAMNMPKELGGGGLSMFQQVLVSEQIGRVILPTIRGERQECYAITEEGAGSDLDAIQATARREVDAYVLNGRKWHVTSFNTADYVFFQGKIEGGPNAGSHAMFLVDEDTPGVRPVRDPAYTHTLIDTHTELGFEDVRVPAANLIGSEGDGLKFVYSWFRYERLMIAARCCGAAERLIDEATAFAKDRVQFGRPIIENQAIAHMLAESLTE